MLILIPTVPRKSGISYVKDAARAILIQLAAQPRCGARFTVYQARQTPEAVAVAATLDALRQSFPTVSGLFQVVNRPPDLKDMPRPPGFAVKGDLTPGDTARQQTRDTVSMIRYGLSQCTSAGVRHVLLIEDDFVLCPNALQLVAHAIERANRRNPNWSSVRVGYGMNGIVMRCHDLEATASYLTEEQIMMPVDLLTDEWHMRSTIKGQTQFPGGRQAYFFRHNLLKHIGTVSTFQGRAERPSLGCGATLQLINSFVPDTRFDEGRCPNDDLSPCVGVASGGPMPQLSFTNVQSTAFTFPV